MTDQMEETHLACGISQIAEKRRSRLRAAVETLEIEVRDGGVGTAIGHGHMDS